jgi:hypothetical protein
MEFAEDGVFEDELSMAVSNRDFPAVKFASSAKGSSLTVSTSDLVVSCSDCSQPFSPKTLSASFKFEGKKGAWRFGQKDPKNLKGTYRTLDCTLGDHKVKIKDWATWDLSKDVKIPLCDGLISRSGWAVYDDSGNILLKPGIAKGRLWVAKRPEGVRQDLYLFAYEPRLRGGFARPRRSFRPPAAASALHARLLVQPLLGLHRQGIEALADQFDAWTCL